MAQVKRVRLTPENIKYAKVCIDRDPETLRKITWVRTRRGWREKDVEVPVTPVSNRDMLMCANDESPSGNDEAGGEGAAAGHSEMVECTVCDGSGRRIPDPRDYPEYAPFPAEVPCATCSGTGNVRDPDADDEPEDILADWGTYVVEFLSGRKPPAEKTKKKPEKWVLGYVTAAGDVPPRGTVLHNGECVYRANIDDAVLQQAGWVVVKVAQQVAPKEPERVWRKVMLEASGTGLDARVRFPDGGVFDSKEPVYPSTIADYAAPLPPRPSRAQLEALLDAYSRVGRVAEVQKKAILDLCCGKDGAA